MKQEEPILVAIHCLVYNHEPYLRDCFEGFVKQKTNFRYVAIVHDDVSKDGSAAIIREYKEKYPDIFRPIYETENQWHRADGSIERIMNEAITATGAKYVAMCEGDDYWTDPLKLQKQVDFLESHSDSIMCVHAAQWMLGENGEKEILGCNYLEECELTTDEIIRQGGLYTAMASTIFRTYSIPKGEDCPTWWKMADVGDYPLHIYAALHGKVHFFPEAMCVYRYQHQGSWTYNQRKSKNIEHAKCEIAWMEELDKETEGKYSDAIYYHLYGFYKLLFLAKEISSRTYYEKTCRTGVISRYKYIKHLIKRILS